MTRRPCNVGFIPATQIRSPADETLRDLPTDLYCKAAQNDPAVVRGARNYPCMEFPGKRAPTVQLCRDPEGYVPIGSNPWRGATHPVRHSGPGRPEHLAAQQVPVHPTGGRLRSGPAGRPAPAGCAPGPGPAPNAPFPLPVPPERQRAADRRGRTTPRRIRSCRRMPARPWRRRVRRRGRYRPTPPAPDAPLPAEAPQPQAGGVSYGTYDRDGKFIDPCGQYGRLRRRRRQAIARGELGGSDEGSEAGVMTQTPETATTESARPVPPAGVARGRAGRRRRRGRRR